MSPMRFDFTQPEETVRNNAILTRTGDREIAPQGQVNVPELTAAIKSLGLALRSSSSPESPFDGNPLERLPFELVIRILETVMELFGMLWSPHNLRQLASVCKHWRDIILSTPQFWTYIVSSEMLNIYLKRSVDASLDIQILRFRGSFSSLKSRRALQAHSGRWRSLEVVQAPNCMQSLLPTLSRPLPSLERLELRNAEPGSPGPCYAIVLGEAPRLRTLNLQEAFVKVPDSNQLPNLKILALSKISRNIAYDILALLATCPALEQLTLQDIWPRNLAGAGVDHASPHGSALPNLQRLVLEDVHEQIADTLFQYSSTENLTYFQYRQIRHRDESTPLVHRHLHEPVLPILRRTPFRGITIDIHSGLINIQVRDFVDITFIGSNLSVKYLHILATALQFSNLDVTLRIAEDCLTQFFDSIDEIPSHVFNTRTMYTWIRGSADLTNILRVLSRRDASGSLPFATLSRLVVKSTHSEVYHIVYDLMSDIQACLKIRNNPAEHTSGRLAQKLTFDWYDGMTVDECKGVLVSTGRQRALKSRSAKAESRSKALRPRRKI